MKENEKLLLQKLEAVTAAWRRLHEDSVPNLPLKWEIGDGIAFLDGTWIAPVKFINTEKLDWCVEVVYPISFEIPLTDGSLDIIIIKEQGDFEIQAIDRRIVR